MVDSRVLQGESLKVFSEGIGLILKQWWALRTAVENELGGRDSHRKAQKIATELLSWFTQTKEPLYIDVLDNILIEGMLSLNVGVEDGSIEEVADDLGVKYEECLEGNFRSVENLREAILKQPAHPHVAQIVNNDEDDEDDEDDGDDSSANMDEDDEDDDGDENIVGDNSSANMDVDIPKSQSSNMNSVNRPVNGPLPGVSGEADDGWAVVNRKSKGRKK